VIRIADEQRVLKLPVALLRSTARAVMRGERLAGDVSLAFVDNRRIREINRRFLGHDFATDVISFPLGGAAELVISTEYARAEARSRGIAVEEELRRYVVHGLLHLAGYDDHAPAARRKMWARQESYVASTTGRPSRGRSRAP